MKQCNSLSIILKQACVRGKNNNHNHDCNQVYQVPHHTAFNSDLLLYNVHVVINKHHLQLNYREMSGRSQVEDYKGLMAKS